MPILIDVFTVGFIALMVFMAYKRGFVSTILDLVGFLVSSIVASLLSDPIADFIFKNFLRSSLIDSVSGQVKALPAGIDVGDALTRVYDQLPGFVTGFVKSGSMSETAIMKSVENAAAGSVDRLSTQIVDTIFAPVVLMLVSAIVFIVLFSIGMLVFKILSRSFSFVNRVPLIGGANRILGAVFGLLKALIFVMVIAIIIGMIDGFLGGGLQSDINKSVIFRIFYNYNPFLSLIPKIGHI